MLKKLKLSKTKILIISIGVIALFFTAISGTIAWLTSKSETVTNTFTYGDINITLSETDTKDDNDLNTNTYEMVPGNKITKDPLITLAENSEDCYIFVKLEKTDNFDNYMEYQILENWLLLEGTDNVYYQEVSKSTTKQEFYILKDNSISVKESVTKKMLNELDKEGIDNYPKLNITAYAVQRDSELDAISTASNAWALINAQA